MTVDVENDVDEGSSSDFVAAVARGLSVLEAFGSERRMMPVSEVARRVGLSRASARRIALTLTQLGYLRQEGKQFALAPRVLSLGFAYLSALSLPESAQPHLESLSLDLQESSSVSVLDGSDIVYVARRPMKRIMSVTISVGTRFPAHATSMGRVMLAHLPAAALDEYLGATPLSGMTKGTVTDAAAFRDILHDIASKGWAVVDQELEVGLRSIAVPLRAPSGDVIAAMNVSTHMSRASIDDLVERALPRLKDAARAVERDYGAVIEASSPS